MHRKFTFGTRNIAHTKFISSMGVQVTVSTYQFDAGNGISYKTYLTSKNTVAEEDIEITSSWKDKALSIHAELSRMVKMLGAREIETSAQE